MEFKLTPQKDTTAAFKKLLDIIITLRSPEGCPWDRKQTAASLLPHLLEETYECIDAVHNNDNENLSEEVGDLYLLVVMISYILEQEENIPIYQTLNGISEKLIRRHPHVFSDTKVADADEVVTLWNKIKTDVEKRPDKDSLLDTIPLSMPPMERAFRIQKKAAHAGFDWKDYHGVSKKITEEIAEFQEALLAGNTEEMENEFGDILFSLINAARHMHIDPINALHKTNQKFARRFRYIEKKVKEKGSSIEKASPNEMETFWEEAKKQEG